VSRQIAALEQELGLKLFDRVGRRLVLTGEGEQMLGDCRALLNYAGALDERAQLLRRGDTGVLRVASSPQFIEGVIADFWYRYAERYPNVQLKLIESVGWSGMREMLERGEIHLGQNLLHAAQPDDSRFSSHPIPAVDLLAACHPELPLGRGGAIEISELASHPLLLLGTGFIFRRLFDAACRLAGLEPNVKFESQTPHTLLAMAESGHGVAIVPSTLRMQRYALRLVSVNYRGKALRQPLAVFWDRRRPLPPYATGFCEMLAAYVGEVFPITRPSEPRSDTATRPVRVRAKRRSGGKKRTKA
jgi:DNA-binding transcriptional LysR family regulator